MRKLLAFLLILLLVLSMSACAPAEEDGEDTENDQGTENGDAGDDTGGEDEDDDYATDEGEDKGPYVDGTYEAFGDAWEHGQESATIEIAEGEITEVYLRRLTADGSEEVDYDLWTGEERDGKLYPNLKQYKDDMATAMIEAQSYDVDIIAGATTTTENWKLAAQRALEEAKE